MNRRDAIHRAGLLAGAATLWASLPARTWAALAAPAGWSAEEENLLSLIGDTIIPATASSPGAGSVGIGRFIITQAGECYVAGTGEALRRGLREIRDASQREFSKPFEDLNVAQREKVLTDYERQASGGRGNAINPFRLMKELTLLGYFTSEPGATRALRYLPVPGGYRGSLPLGQDDRCWAL
ncbi:MAG: gluconate 2-dehydrogenase subunit 3 family protein [Opitutus sp.]|nr:gluconate 2-dehydrogenase subunit 3 family protein [Opitutus sp.]